MIGDLRDDGLVVRSLQSDHRPILLRLTAGTEAAAGTGDALIEEEAQRVLRGLRERRQPRFTN